MLAVGICATLAVVLLAPLLLAPRGVSDDRPQMLGLPANAVWAAVAVGLAVVGLLWMVRIYRGSSEESSDWRHRR
jgi:hypothetical protein